MVARPEITGRGFATAEPSKTISEFCATEKMSRSKYYDLRRKGLTPDEMRAGGIIRITPEAHAKWRRKHTGPPPKPNRPVRELPRGRDGSSP